MLFSNYVNRAGRLLGAATVAGALSLGLLVAPAATATTAANSIKSKASTSDSYVSSGTRTSDANSI